MKAGGGVARVEARGSAFASMLKSAKDRCTPDMLYGEACTGDLVVQVSFDGTAGVYRLERELSSEEVDRIVRSAE